MLETKFVVIYRWRVHSDREAEFRAAWLWLTQQFRAYRGSHGSRLTRDAAGTFVAIASWPSREAWAATAPRIPDEDTYLARLRGAIAETLPIECLDVQLDG